MITRENRIKVELGSNRRDVWLAYCDQLFILDKPQRCVCQIDQRGARAALLLSSALSLCGRAGPLQKFENLEPSHFISPSSATFFFKGG